MTDLLFPPRTRYWSVVFVGNSQTLPAYHQPAGHEIVYAFEPTSAGIPGTGQAKTVHSTEWLPVDTPKGPGWIYRNYLTQQVSFEVFSKDPRPARLVHEFADRLRRGRDVGRLVSERGLVVAMLGPTEKLSLDHLRSLVGKSRIRHAWSVDELARERRDFEMAVTRPFLEAYEATAEVTSATPHSRDAEIPTECWNFPYLAVGPGGDVQPWLVFFEYLDGKAWIAGLGIDE